MPPTNFGIITKQRGADRIRMIRTSAFASYILSQFGKFIQNQQRTRLITNLTSRPQKLSCRNPDSPDTLNSLHDDSRVFLPGQLPFQSLHVIQIDKCHLMSPIPRCLYCRVIRDGNGPARTPVKGSVHGQYFRTPRNKRRQFQGILVSLRPAITKEQIIIRATGKLPQFPLQLLLQMLLHQRHSFEQQIFLYILQLGR